MPKIISIAGKLSSYISSLIEIYVSVLISWFNCYFILYGIDICLIYKYEFSDYFKCSLILIFVHLTNATSLNRLQLKVIWAIIMKKQNVVIC